jgi:hypothetical protein
VEGGEKREVEKDEEEEEAEEKEGKCVRGRK